MNGRYEASGMWGVRRTKRGAEPMAETILVVDDQPGARKVLAAELEDAGFQVVLAADGVEAWQQFRQASPDLVITDMVMPRSDGIDLLNRIRSHSEVPVLLFSAHGSVEAAVTALKSGADDFVSSETFHDDWLASVVGNGPVAAAYQ